MHCQSGPAQPASATCCNGTAVRRRRCSSPCSQRPLLRLSSAKRGALGAPGRAEGVGSKREGRGEGGSGVDLGWPPRGWAEGLLLLGPPVDRLAGCCVQDAAESRVARFDARWWPSATFPAAKLACKWMELQIDNKRVARLSVSYAVRVLGPSRPRVPGWPVQGPNTPFRKGPTRFHKHVVCVGLERGDSLHEAARVSCGARHLPAATSLGAHGTPVPSESLLPSCPAAVLHCRSLVSQQPALAHHCAQPVLGACSPSIAAVPTLWLLLLAQERCM